MRARPERGTRLEGFCPANRFPVAPTFPESARPRSVKKTGALELLDSVRVDPHEADAASEALERALRLISAWGISPSRAQLTHDELEDVTRWAMEDVHVERDPSGNTHIEFGGRLGRLLWCLTAAAAISIEDLERVTEKPRNDLYRDIEDRIRRAVFEWEGSIEDLEEQDDEAT